jgi:P4 family phage/plasmid primase-like protien
MTVSAVETEPSAAVSAADDAALERSIADGRFFYGPDVPPDPGFDPGGDAREQVIRWAIRHGLTMYQGWPGNKHPRKYHPQPGSCPEAGPQDLCRCWVTWAGDGPLLIRVPQHMAVIDEDGPAAAPVVAALGLPDHFAIRSRKSGGIKRFLFMAGGVRRAVRPDEDIPLDVIGNPDGRCVWLKIWDDDGYDVITQTDAVPEGPESILELLKCPENGSAVRGKARGASPVPGGADLPATGSLVAEGISYGSQEDQLKSVAAREARTQWLQRHAFDEDAITATLAAIARASEQDDSDPWRMDQLRAKAASAIRFITSEVAREAAVQQEAAAPGPGGQETAPAKERPLSRHTSIPRLRVAPPVELDRYADEIVTGAAAPVRGAAEAARPEDPEADDAEWGDMKAALDLVEPAAEVLGGLGDLDLIDFQAARSTVCNAALPYGYLKALSQDSRDEEEASFSFRFLNGWNKGASAGHEVPAELRAALDSWHPPCPLPREDVEAHRLPPGREGAWPVQNFVSNTDDRGNASRLLDHYGDRIMFTHAPTGLGEYAFDGQRWMETASGGRGLVGELADQTIGSLPVTEAMSLSVAVTGFDRKGNPVSDRARYWAWLNAQQSKARQSAMIKAAADRDGKRAAISVFDADPRWLNTPSGEVDLGRPEIGNDGKWSTADPITFTRRHFPEHRHARITGAPYDESATCPEWEKAMLAWLGDDAELVTYVGKLVAASVRGLVGLKLFVILLGSRNSGKTSFLEVLMDVLGGYATTAQPSILRKGNRGGSTLSDDVADLRGFRFVTTTETSGAEEMDEPRVKRLSGGDRVRARGLYQSSAAWEPFFVFWLATNEMPRISGADAALWGRIPPVRFPFTFNETGLTPDGKPCGRADPTLKRKLLAEAPGILTWIIRHLELLYREGLCEPEAVGQERRKLQSQQNTVEMFLAAVEADSGTADALDGIEAGGDLKIRFTRLLKHYETWAKKSAITPVGKDLFRQALENRHVKITLTHNVDTVHGFGHQPDHPFECPVCKEPPAPSSKN